MQNFNKFHVYYNFYTLFSKIIIIIIMHIILKKYYINFMIKNNDIFFLCLMK